MKDALKEVRVRRLVGNIGRWDQVLVLITTSLCVLTIRSPGDEAFIYGTCQFPWCRYAHHDQLQATDIIPLNLVCEESCTISCAPTYHCHQATFPDSPMGQEPWAYFIESLLFFSYFLLVHFTHLGLISLIKEVLLGTVIHSFLHLLLQYLIHLL